MIIVDETVPIGDLPPPFPSKDVVVRFTDDVSECYDLKKEIGRGRFGTVYLCSCKKTGLNFAAKFVKTKRAKDRENVEREIEVMKILNREKPHPKLIQLYDAFDMGQQMCLVLEVVDGGELFERVIDDDFVLTERACAIFLRQICEGIEFIHSKNVLHLDMKPENILCLSRQGNRVKICDFGLARCYDPRKKLQVLFGTPEFVAPEVVLFEPIGFSTDMWSVGVICYVLLSGLSPFLGANYVETMTNVTKKKYDFDDDAFDDISDQAKDFIERLLILEKSERLTPDQCISHPWMKKCLTGPPIQNKIATTNDTKITQTLCEKVDEVKCDNVMQIKMEVNADIINSDVNTVSTAENNSEILHIIHNGDKICVDNINNISNDTVVPKSENIIDQSQEQLDSSDRKRKERDSNECELESAKKQLKDFVEERKSTHNSPYVIASPQLVHNATSESTVNNELIKNYETTPIIINIPVEQLHSKIENTGEPNLSISNTLVPEEIATQLEAKLKDLQNNEIQNTNTFNKENIVPCDQTNISENSMIKGEKGKLNRQDAVQSVMTNKNSKTDTEPTQKFRPSRDVPIKSNKPLAMDINHSKTENSKSPSSHTPLRRSRRSSKEEFASSDKIVTSQPLRRPSRDVPLHSTQAIRFNTTSKSNCDKINSQEMWPDVYCLTQDQDHTSAEYPILPVTGKFELPVVLLPINTKSVIEPNKNSYFLTNFNSIEKRNSIDDTEIDSTANKNVKWIMNLNSHQVSSPITNIHAPEFTNYVKQSKIEYKSSAYSNNIHNANITLTQMIEIKLVPENSEKSKSNEKFQKIDCSEGTEYKCVNETKKEETSLNLEQCNNYYNTIINDSNNILFDAQIHDNTLMKDKICCQMSNTDSQLKIENELINPSNYDEENTNNCTLEEYTPEPLWTDKSNIKLYSSEKTSDFIDNCKPLDNIKLTKLERINNFEQPRTIEKTVNASNSKQEYENINTNSSSAENTHISITGGQQKSHDILAVNHLTSSKEGYTETQINSQLSSDRTKLNYNDKSVKPLNYSEVNFNKSDIITNDEPSTDINHSEQLKGVNRDQSIKVDKVTVSSKFTADNLNRKPNLPIPESSHKNIPHDVSKRNGSEEFKIVRMKKSSSTSSLKTSDSNENVTVSTPWGPMRKSPSRKSLRSPDRNLIIVNLSNSSKECNNICNSSKTAVLEKSDVKEKNVRKNGLKTFNIPINNKYPDVLTYLDSNKLKEEEQVLINNVDSSKDTGKLYLNTSINSERIPRSNSPTSNPRKSDIGNNLSRTVSVKNNYIDKNKNSAKAFKKERELKLSSRKKISKNIIYTEEDEIPPMAIKIDISYEEMFGSKKEDNEKKGNMNTLNNIDIKRIIKSDKFQVNKNVINDDINFNQYSPSNTETLLFQNRGSYLSTTNDPNNNGIINQGTKHEMNSSSSIINIENVVRERHIPIVLKNIEIEKANTNHTITVESNNIFVPEIEISSGSVELQYDKNTITSESETKCNTTRRISSVKIENLTESSEKTIIISNEQKADFNCNVSKSEKKSNDQIIEFKVKSYNTDTNTKISKIEFGNNQLKLDSKSKEIKIEVKSSEPKSEIKNTESSNFSKGLKNSLSMNSSLDKFYDCPLSIDKKYLKDKSFHTQLKLQIPEQTYLSENWEIDKKNRLNESNRSQRDSRGSSKRNSLSDSDREDSTLMGVTKRKIRSGSLASSPSSFRMSLFSAQDRISLFERKKENIQKERAPVPISRSRTNVLIREKSPKLDILNNLNRNSLYSHSKTTAPPSIYTHA